MNPLNPYTWMIGALVLAFVGGSGYLYGRADGKKIERAQWQAKELKASQDAQDALATAQAAVTAAERKSAQDLADVSTHYQKELNHVSATKDATIAALRTGAVRLRDPGTKYTLGSNAVPDFGASAGRSDGKAEGELSKELAEYLVTEASRADAIAIQLTSCQAVIIKDREICK